LGGKQQQQQQMANINTPHNKLLPLPMNVVRDMTSFELMEMKPELSLQSFCFSRNQKKLLIKLYCIPQTVNGER
jgi:hypothetical protein